MFKLNTCPWPASILSIFDKRITLYIRPNNFSMSPTHYFSSNQKNLQDLFPYFSLVNLLSCSSFFSSTLNSHFHSLKYLLSYRNQSKTNDRQRKDSQTKFSPRIWSHFSIGRGKTGKWQPTHGYFIGWVHAFYHYKPRVLS